MEKPFVMGVINAFNTDMEGVYAFEGKVSGAVAVGDIIRITDPGADRNASFVVPVVDISVRAGESYDSRKAVENQDAVIYLKLNPECEAKNCVVLHSEGVSGAEIRNAYLNVLGNVYVVARDLNLEDSELEDMSVSVLTDLFICFEKYHGSRHESNAKKASYGEKLEKIYEKIAKKFMELETVNIVYYKTTDEPFMYSKLYQLVEGAYNFTLPDVMFITDARLESVKANMRGSQFEYRRIGNADIKNMLLMCFYVNGAVGVRVNGDIVRIPADKLVEKPEKGSAQFDETANPDFVRWSLLVGQLGKIDSNEKKLAYAMFAPKLEEELMKAKFLVPAQKNGEHFKVSIMDGRGEKPALPLFADWKKLRKAYDGTWGALAQTVDDVIDMYDITINPVSQELPSMYLTADDVAALRKSE